MAQGDSILISNEWQMGKFHQMEPTGLAKIKKEHPFQLNDHPDEPFPNFHAEDNSINSFLNGESSTTSLKTNGVTLHIGNEFEANHLYGSIPADPAMAISNGGRIVSIDNATIAYFKETGDTIVKYGLPLANWYQDSTMDRGPFDPRVIYDSYTDRFISVLLYLSDDYTESRVLVSFSQAFGPDSISWNHYQIHCDSIYTEANEAMYWLDYPNIAINKNELFITLSVFDHDSINNSDTKEKTLLLQIEKAPGYAGAANINCKEWKNVLNADGNSSGTFVPVGEALQSASYGPGCYMVSNYSQNSTNFFWYELTGDINNAGAQIISHLIASSFFYSHPSYATQMGGNGGDRIKFGDCRIRSGFYQNGKLHFVFHRSDNGWGEIVYAKITLANNMFEANTWGGDEESLNSFYPSIAPYGKDSTEENSVITFSRSGPTIFPEVCVINYDSAWSPAVTVVKTGLGVIDQQIDLVAPWDTLERIGDYSDIQRRYSDPQNACWLIGSYASGPVANHFGVTDGIKLWIAEIGDSAIVSIPKPVSVSKFQMFPNPVFNGEQALNFHLNSS
ncbi:MAG TPA: hypothetical protein ENJ82_02955, partial [Bacteroidetes bacterium]|nr:hypothetical protein [Bacteroidota bacterium]